MKLIIQILLIFYVLNCSGNANICDLNICTTPEKIICDLKKEDCPPCRVYMNGNVLCMKDNNGLCKSGQTLCASNDANDVVSDADDKPLADESAENTSPTVNSTSRPSTANPFEPGKLTPTANATDSKDDSKEITTLTPTNPITTVSPPVTAPPTSFRPPSRPQPALTALPGSGTSPTPLPTPSKPAPSSAVVLPATNTVSSPAPVTSPSSSRPESGTAPINGENLSTKEDGNGSGSSPVPIILGCVAGIAGIAVAVFFGAMKARQKHDEDDEKYLNKVLGVSKSNSIVTFSETQSPAIEFKEDNILPLRSNSIPDMDDSRSVRSSYATNTEVSMGQFKPSVISSSASSFVMSPSSTVYTDSSSHLSVGQYSESVAPSEADSGYQSSIVISQDESVL